MWQPAAVKKLFIAAAEEICTNKRPPVKVHLGHMCAVEAPIALAAVITVDPEAAHCFGVLFEEPWASTALLYMTSLKVPYYVKKQYFKNNIFQTIVY